MFINKTDKMCKITKKVVDDFNILTDAQFMRKYSCSKTKYYKRVKLYGDPYMKAPLAIIGKLLIRKSIFK